MCEVAAVVAIDGLEVTVTAVPETKYAKSGDLHIAYQAAARTTTWALTQYPSSAELQELRKIAFLKQKEKYQELNPFKVIIYSEAIQHGTPQLQHALPNKGMEADAP